MARLQLSCMPNSHLLLAFLLGSPAPAPAIAAAQTPDPPAQRPQLDKAIALIDEVNAQDPTKVPVDGASVPYR
jgi:hypothetical protein